MDYYKSGGSFIFKDVSGWGNREFGLIRGGGGGGGLGTIPRVDHTDFSNKQKIISILHRERGRKVKMLKHMTLEVLQPKILTSTYE